LADTSENIQFIIKNEDIYYEEDTNKFKKILSCISEEFKVNNIINLDFLQFKFEIKIPNDTSFKISKNMKHYISKENDTLLEIFNKLIWLYWLDKKQFKKDLVLFEYFIKKLKLHDEYEITDEILKENNINLLNKIVYDSKKFNNMQEFINDFYRNYGFDLKECIEKGLYSSEERFNYHQVNISQNKILSKLQHRGFISVSSKNIISYIYASKPVHRLIKDYSIQIEINPLVTKEKLIKKFNEHYEMYSEFNSILRYFELDEPYEYEKVNNKNKLDKSTYKMKKHTDVYSNVPRTIRGTDIIKKALIIYSIMEYYKLENIQIAISYYNYFIIRDNYQSLFIDGEPLLEFLNNDIYENVGGIISFKNKNTINILQKSQTRSGVVMLVKYLNQHL